MKTTSTARVTPIAASMLIGLLLSRPRSGPASTRITSTWHPPHRHCHRPQTGMCGQHRAALHHGDVLVAAPVACAVAAARRRRAAGESAWVDGETGLVPRRELQGSRGQMPLMARLKPRCAPSAWSAAFFVEQDDRLEFDEARNASGPRADPSPLDGEIRAKVWPRRPWCCGPRPRPQPPPRRARPRPGWLRRPPPPPSPAPPRGAGQSTTLHARRVDVARPRPMPTG